MSYACHLAQAHHPMINLNSRLRSKYEVIFATVWASLLSLFLSLSPSSPETPSYRDTTIARFLILAAKSVFPKRQGFQPLPDKTFWPRKSWFFAEDESKSQLHPMLENSSERGKDVFSASSESSRITPVIARTTQLSPGNVLLEGLTLASSTTTRSMNTLCEWA